MEKEGSSGAKCRRCSRQQVVGWVGLCEGCLSGLGYRSSSQDDISQSATQAPSSARRLGQCGKRQAPPTKLVGAAAASSSSSTSGTSGTTPTGGDGSGGTSTSGSSGTTPATMDAATTPTPTGADGSGGTSTSGSRGTTPATMDAATTPTPTGADGSGGASTSGSSGSRARADTASSRQRANSRSASRGGSANAPAAEPKICKVSGCRRAAVQALRRSNLLPTCEGHAKYTSTGIRKAAPVDADASKTKTRTLAAYGYLDGQWFARVGGDGRGLLGQVTAVKAKNVRGDHWQALVDVKFTDETTGTYASGVVISWMAIYVAIKEAFVGSDPPRNLRMGGAKATTSERVVRVTIPFGTLLRSGQWVRSVSRPNLTITVYAANTDAGGGGGAQDLTAVV